jgi:hypothetical protein
MDSPVYRTKNDESPFCEQKTVDLRYAFDNRFLTDTVVFLRGNIGTPKMAFYDLQTEKRILLRRDDIQMEVDNGEYNAEPTKEVLAETRNLEKQRFAEALDGDANIYLHRIFETSAPAMPFLKMIKAHKRDWEVLVVDFGFYGDVSWNMDMMLLTDTRYSCRSADDWAEIAESYTEDAIDRKPVNDGWCDYYNRFDLTQCPYNGPMHFEYYHLFYQELFY